MTDNAFKASGAWKIGSITRSSPST